MEIAMKKEPYKNSLISLEYITSFFEEEIKSFFIKDYTMTITYKDKTKKRVSIKEEGIHSIQNLFQKYEVINWKDLDGDDLEFMDGDNTQVYYEFDGNIKGHVSIEEHAKGGLSFFYELEKFLKRLIK